MAWLVPVPVVRVPVVPAPGPCARDASGFWGPGSPPGVVVLRWKMAAAPRPVQAERPATAAIRKGRRRARTSERQRAVLLNRGGHDINRKA
ncbi:MAG: hypothetical protein JWN98_1000 [Abditibacteriota bacterium]|nr:hypothetical protein [Abditibacteriota bacterium]